jgi:HPt (histidine-containing phosphotransfer) domain-containing protein
MDAHDIILSDLSREAHALKSTAATFGALPLAEAASALEQACRNGANGEVDRLRRALPRLIEEAVAAFQRQGYLRPSPPPVPVEGLVRPRQP